MKACEETKTICFIEWEKVCLSFYYRCYIFISVYQHPFTDSNSIPNMCSNFSIYIVDLSSLRSFLISSP